MDQPFPLERLKPSRSPSPRQLSPDQLASLVQQLADQTKNIRDQPYSPSAWLDRAATLDALGYPELAVGDAWKAERLARRMLAFPRERKDRRWRLGQGSGFWMCYVDMDSDRQDDKDEVLLVRLQDHLAKAGLMMKSNLCSYPGSGYGRFIPQEYPWLSDRHRHRSDGVVAEINENLSRNTVRTAAGKPYCEVKRCSFGLGGDTEARPPTAFGMFATCNIRQGTEILLDRTELFGCIGPSGSRSKLTGAICGDPFHPNTKDDEGSMDLRWVRERLRGRAAETLLVCRVFLACVQQRNAHSAQAPARCVTHVMARSESAADHLDRHHLHPLDLPEIARIVPTYHEQKPRMFRLDSDVAVPNEALQQFGIDIYTDERFDTWVLFTVAARLDNNGWTSPTCAVFNPLFSLFNHSCEPNVDWRSSKDHRTIKMTTTKDVAKSEQLFVEYDSFEHKKPLQQRRERLSKWIDGPCLCSRCAREDQESDGRKADPQGGVDEEVSAETTAGSLVLSGH